MFGGIWWLVVQLIWTSLWTSWGSWAARRFLLEDWDRFAAEDCNLTGMVRIAMVNRSEVVALFVVLLSAPILLGTRLLCFQLGLLQLVLDITILSGSFSDIAIRSSL